MHKLMKQQNVTTISAEAELCRAINGHGDLQELTDTGPWTARLLCPCFLPALVQREAPRVLIHAPGRRRSSSCLTPQRIYHSHVPLLWLKGVLVCFQDQETCRKLLQSTHQCIKIIKSLVCPFQVQKGHSDYPVWFPTTHAKWFLDQMLKSD